MRAGILAALASDHLLQCVGAASDASEGKKIVRRVCPDLAVVDLMLGGAGARRFDDGLAFIADLHYEFPPLRLVVYSAVEDIGYARRALTAGARGYVSKSEVETNLLGAIHTVLAGERYLSPRIFVDTARQFTAAVGSKFATLLARLTNRELHVLHATGLGLPNRRIAADLGLSVKTVESYKESLKEKIDARDAEQLAVKARAFSAALIA